jgi:hypothetical protein
MLKAHVAIQTKVSASPSSPCKSGQVYSLIKPCKVYHLKERYTVVSKVQSTPEQLKRPIKE